MSHRRTSRFPDSDSRPKLRTEHTETAPRRGREGEFRFSPMPVFQMLKRITNQLMRRTRKKKGLSKDHCLMSRVMPLGGNLSLESENLMEKSLNFIESSTLLTDFSGRLSGKITLIYVK
ncbi:unnamed protein product [Nesidiocoris tenuis]|uniref:Uncharacterized protein n=1 Tax=Nesidiocoris tenuis TaxID=355587 RepID=A0A6H5HF98_9HEMI|nr:unnamed protein product [Nesidiocoris tenuis]